MADEGKVPDSVGASADAAEPAAVAAAAPDSAGSADAELSSASGAQPFSLPDFGGGEFRQVPVGISMLADVNLNVKIELGRTRMLVENVLRLAEGSVVELDKLAGDPVDVFVNDRHVARGEVLVLNDNFCVRISEIIAPLGVTEATSAAAATTAAA
ncbi:MAG: flagellar motor switch protein FliN [Phycisphaerae bacterium]|nr:flagellar motor switch protein FliN [Phycisphaerae bacterium]